MQKQQPIPSQLPQLPPPPADMPESLTPLPIPPAPMITLDAPPALAQHSFKKLNLLIGVTGSVATIKLPQLLSELLPFFNIKVIVTKNAKNFIGTEEYQIEFQKYAKSKTNTKIDKNMEEKEDNSIQSSKSKQEDIGIADVQMLQDEMQWKMWNKRGDPVLHIQLRKWANILLIAPLSAHTLSKLSTGQCDNLLTLVCRAWPIPISPVLGPAIIVCPSMNTLMWQHPITSQQIAKLQKWGYTVVGPVSKKMMCGDIGNGALADVNDIVHAVKKLSNYQQTGQNSQHKL